MAREQEDFTDILERAQRVRASGDLGSLYETTQPPGRVAFEPRQDRLGPEADVDAHCEVFSLPPDRREYEDVLNKIARGEALLRYEDRTFTKEGDFMVAICYLTPRLQPRPENNQDAGDAEPEERPRKLP